MRSRYGIVELDFEISKSIRYHAYRRSFWEGLALPWQFKGTFRGISVGYEFRIGKAKRRRYLWKRKNCQSSAIQRHVERSGLGNRSKSLCRGTEVLNRVQFGNCSLAVRTW